MVRMFLNRYLIVTFLFCFSIQSCFCDHPYYLIEDFEADDFESQWTYSSASKSSSSDETYQGKFELIQDGTNNHAIKMASEKSHYAISRMLEKPVNFDHERFIVQFRVKLPPKLDCGGAYLKLISKQDDFDPQTFRDNTPFTIMFGPDKCGVDKRIHFIFQHKNPLTNLYEEKHLKKIDYKTFDHIFSDDKYHLLKLILLNTNSYKISLDGKTIARGSLFTDFNPPVNPPKMIVDKDDVKPDDWDERETIPDPNAVKPDDIDETQPPYIPDPNAVKPENWYEDEPEFVPKPDVTKPSDWDDEQDGEWEPELIPNPKCEKNKCGKWVRPQISNPKYKVWTHPIIKNPNYKGIFKPRMIPNPDYYFDPEPYKMRPISAIGFELWTVVPGVTFDNILITYDPTFSKQFDHLTYRTDYVKLFKNYFDIYLNSRYFIHSIVISTICAIVFIYYFLKPSTVVKPPTPETQAKNEEPKEGKSEHKNDEDPLSDLKKRGKKAQQVNGS